MLHEIKNIIKAAQSAETEGIKTVLASVVSLEDPPTEDLVFACPFRKMVK